MMYLVNQTKLLFWKKMCINSNGLLVYLAALRQLVVSTVYTRCGRLLDLSSLLFGSYFTETVHI